MEWTVAKEELPKPYKPCLISDGNIISIGRYHPDVAVEMSNGQFGYESAYWEDMAEILSLDFENNPRVRYWKELPPIPSEYSH